jgi:gliding motility-associated-like protein
LFYVKKIQKLLVYYIWFPIFVVQLELTVFSIYNCMKNLKFSAVLLLSVLFFNFVKAQPVNNLEKLAAKKMKETERYLSNLGNLSARGQRGGGGANQPEQNCSSAIPVCQQTYTQGLSYSGSGTTNDLGNNNTCLLTGETNSVWYVFTAQTSGTFTFSIQTQRDYDFALYNTTNTGCNLGGVTPLRCNYSADNGATGLQLPAQNGNLSFSASQGSFMPGINVNAGETYVLLVNNYSGDQNGYTITFGGSASIFDNNPPTFTAVINDCQVGTLTLDPSEPLSCASFANATVNITGPATATVNSFTGVGCSGTATTATTAQINYTLSAPVDGVYSATISGLQDLCGNLMQPVTLNFNVLHAPVATASPQFTCITNPQPIELSIPQPAAGINVLWSNGATTATTTVNPQATTTYSVTLSNANCNVTSNITVDVIQIPPVSIFPPNPFVCGAGSPVTLTANTGAGASFLWSTSETTSSIVVSPSSTTDYSVTVTFGGSCQAADTVTVVSGQPAGEPVCNNIYVTPNGTGVGTRANPADLLTGLSLAQCNNTVIKMAVGTYNLDNAISTMTSYTSLEGGFDNANNWTKTSVAGSTTIVRSNLNPDGPASAPRLVAFYLNGQSFFRFQDITIQVQDALPAAVGQAGVTTYGLHLTNCNDYDIVRTQVIAGNGGTGGQGVAGTAGTTGPNGATSTNRNGAAGAGGGGNGGNGGGGGFFSGSDGQNGQAGNGGAAGGAGGDGATICAGGFIGIFEGTTPRPGTDGAVGAVGATGTPGTSGTFSGGFFIPGGLGTTGGNGTNGFGGGGAGGAGGATFTDGAGGGGGGGGGTGGTGGSGGVGGGGSFPVYIFNNGANGNIVQSNLTVGSAGVGGTGGTGGAGGAGGAGGNGNTNGCDSSPTGRGGNGGAGGTGGTGGSGAAGVAQQITVDGGAQLATSDVNFNLQAQPRINVTNVSCTETPVNYTTAVADNWNFGSGSNPATDNGDAVTTQYSTVGRKDIVYGADTYTGFYNIATTGGNSTPTIVPSFSAVNGVYKVCVGVPVNFTSSLTGVNYTWDLGGGATPNNYNGPNFQTISAVEFTAPGTYTITLVTESDCCGPSAPATLQVEVIDAPTVTVTPPTSSICEGQSVTLTASGALSYEWNTNEFTTSITVTPTTVGVNTYTVIGTSDLGCRSQPATATVEVTTNPVIDIVGDNSICEGESTTLTIEGAVSGGYQWSGGSTATTQSIEVSPTVDQTVYIAQVINGNCVSNIDTFVVFVDAAPIATITGDTVACRGEAATLIANGGKSYIWNTGDTTAIITVTLNADSVFTVIPTSASGCVGAEVSVNVRVTDIVPVSVTLTSNPATVCTGGTVTFTAAPVNGGTTPSYEWLVNGTSVATTNVPEYAATGLADGDVVTVVLTSSQPCVSGNPATSTNTVTVNVDSFSVSLAADNTTSCEGSDVVFTATAVNAGSAPEYTWSVNGVVVATTTENTYASSTLVNGDVVTVSLTNNTTCPVGSNTASAPVDITVLSAPLVVIEPLDTSVINKFRDPIQLVGTPSGGVFAGPGVEDGFFNPEVADTGLHVVTYTYVASNGCTGTDTLVVEVRAFGPPYAIPTAFTPNGDGMNDVFRVLTQGAIVDEFKIYNRWGELVHDSNINGWDGTIDGKDQPAELYLFRAVITLPDNSKVTEAGQVKLIR